MSKSIVIYPAAPAGWPPLAGDLISEDRNGVKVQCWHRGALVTSFVPWLRIDRIEYTDTDAPVVVGDGNRALVSIGKRTWGFVLDPDCGVMPDERDDDKTWEHPTVHYVMTPGNAAIRKQITDVITGAAA